MKKRIKAALLSVFLIFTVFSGTSYALPQFPMNYVYEEGKNKTAGVASSKIYIPLTYKATDSYFTVYDIDYPDLNAPEDLFVDSHDNIYVADTGNNRIVAFDKAGSTKAVYYGASGSQFSLPKGVYVTAEDEIYVADFGNARIVQMDSDGKLVKEYFKPESDLLSQMESFDVAKVVIGPTGYIYTLVGNEFMAIDNQNRFKGFLGATELGFDLIQFLIRNFASKEQQKKIKKRIPPAYNNLFIDSENRFVACSAADTNQIRVINSVGKNIYKPGFYGEAHSLDENNRLLMPSFVDLTVDKNGIISVIEQRSGKIYQYDGNGNILTVFAGKGRNKGYFTLACSIGSDSAGNLYVLDQTRCNIQKFEPTEFIKKVHAASASFLRGKYDESFTQWKEIVRVNADYPLARRRLGALYYKQEKSQEAMQQYLIADDMGGYSEAFSLYRHEIFKKHFGLTVLIAVMILAALIAGIYYLKKYSDRLRLKAYALRGVKNYKA